jgi:hypothetical protein
MLLYVRIINVYATAVVIIAIAGQVAKANKISFHFHPHTHKNY